MTLRKVGVAAAVLLLSGCHLIPGSDAELIQKAEGTIRAELDDTKGIEFRGSHVGTTAIARKIGMVCGEVASPRFTGWRRYLYGRDSGLHQIEYTSSDAASDPLIQTNMSLFASQWSENC